MASSIPLLALYLDAPTMANLQSISRGRFFSIPPPAGKPPVRWQSEQDFFAAVSKYGLYMPVPWLYLAAQNGLVTVCITDPGPSVWLALKDLTQPTVAALVATVAAIVP